MESPTTPSVNVSAQPSTTTAVDYSVHYQKLQPKFKDCTFDSDKKPEYLRTWLRLLSGIVRNIPNGKPSIITYNAIPTKPQLVRLSYRNLDYN